MQHEQFLPTSAQLHWDVLFSFAANLSTAMLLIDYAAHGIATPTSWPSTIVPRLSEQAKSDLEALRALLAHGAILREFTLLSQPQETQIHENWPAFRAWLSNLSAEQTFNLVDYGLHSNLDYYYQKLAPMPEVEHWLSALQGHEAGVPEQDEQSRRLLRTRAVLASWQVVEPDATLKLVEQPDLLRTTLVRFLDELWEQRFAQEWERQEPVLAMMASTTKEIVQSGPSGMTLGAFILWVTGLEPLADWLRLIQPASHIVFVPCLHLGRYVSIATGNATAYIFYDPLASSAQAKEEHVLPQKEQTVPDPAYQAMDLEQFVPALEALGDSTRLAMLMLLAEHGELFAQQIAEKLQVHQSTISRSMAVLERAGLVQVRRSGGMKIYTVDHQRIRAVGQHLLKVFS